MKIEDGNTPPGNGKPRKEDSIPAFDKDGKNAGKFNRPDLPDPAEPLKREESELKKPKGKKHRGKPTKRKTERGRKAEQKGETLPMGRPTLMTDEVVGKLEAGFMRDFKVNEACFFAGIHKDTYYDWCKRFPDFSDRMERAQAFPGMAAKHNVAEVIIAGRSIEDSWKWLERRERKRYSTRSEHVMNEVPELTQDEKDEMHEALRLAGITKPNRKK